MPARSDLVFFDFGRADLTDRARPMVPTADGVREPQNRRVEIILR